MKLSVQVIATVFMPSALLFLLLLLNDHELMGAHVDGPMRNAPSKAVMVWLIVCNGLYGISTPFPNAFN